MPGRWGGGGDTTFGTRTSLTGWGGLGREIFEEKIRKKKLN